jgi:cyclopropane-fatty-acyl-phospholipid synthase
MLEAVGHENLPRYFAACDALLRPGGRAVIQVITIRDEQYEQYRKGCDFIQRYIFPGGHLPCWGALRDAIDAAPGLRIGNVEDIGHHYARTLQLWREAFGANRERVSALGFDRSFVRRWNYYFSYCEAGFRARMLGNLQLVLHKQAGAESR